MDLKDIVLEEVPLATFEEMEQVWNTSRRKKSGDVYSRIENPIRESDYEKLINDLLNLPCAGNVSVRYSDKRWFKIIQKNKGSKLINIGAQLAEIYPDKTYFLEFKFDNFPNPGRGYIEFREHEGEVVGYKLSISKSLESLFTVKSEQTDYRFNQAIWVPDTV